MFRIVRQALVVLLLAPSGWGQEVSSFQRLFDGLRDHPLLAEGQGVVSLPLDADGKPVLPSGAITERAYIIDTFAGTGDRGFAGDGGPATLTRGPENWDHLTLYRSTPGKPVLPSGAITERANLAQLGGPYDVAVDAADNVYIADRHNHRVRKIDSEGTITTIAGSGVAGSAGDGGPATQAQLSSPRAVAFDADGNLYIAESSGNRIRKIDTGGMISTVAGTGEEGSAGDGGPAIEAELHHPTVITVGGTGNIYVSGFGGHRVRRIDREGTITTVVGTGVKGSSGDGGPATEAQINWPNGLVVDGVGNLFLSDINAARVRMVDASGTITTVAGAGFIDRTGDGGPATEARIVTPSGLALDANGNLFIAEFWEGRIRRVDPSGIITTIAGISEQRSAGDGGLAIDAAIDRPSAIAADSVGNLYVAGAYGNRIRILRPTAQLSRFTVALGASGDSVLLYVTSDGVVRLEGNPLLHGTQVQARNGNTYALGKNAVGTVVAAYVPDEQAVELGQGRKLSITSGEDGAWRIGDKVVRNGYLHVEGGKEYLLEWTGGRWRLARYTLTTVAGSVAVADGVQSTASNLFNPYSLAFDSAGNAYIADFSNHRVRKVARSGVISTFAGTGERGYTGDGGPATDAELDRPTGIAVNSLGEVLLVDSGNVRVRKIDAKGVITTLAGPANLHRPHGLALGPMGNIYITAEAFRNHLVQRIDPEGVIATIAGIPGARGGFVGEGRATSAQFYYPRGLAVDAAGNIYVPDSWNHRVRRINPTGSITTIAGTGERGDSGDGGPAVEARLFYPSAVQVDDAGSVYISDASNDRLRRVDGAGIIETVAGTGEPGHSGDGGPARDAQLDYPRGIAVSAPGALFVAESGNDRVRKIDSEGIISTFAGTGRPYEKGDGAPAVLAQFGYPRDIATDSGGNVYVLDSNQVRKIDASGVIAVIAGTGEFGHTGDGGPAIQAQLRGPTALAVDAFGHLYIAGRSNHRLRRVDRAGVITTIAGTGRRGFSGDGGPAINAQLNAPTAIAVDSVGNIYIAEYGGHRVRRIDASGTITTFAGTGVPDRTEEFGYVLSTGDSASDYDPQPDGTAPALQTRLTYPIGVAADAEDNVYILDQGNRGSIPNGRIGKIDGSSPDPRIVPLPFAEIPRVATDFAVDEHGSIFISYRGRVLNFGLDGSVATIAGGGTIRPINNGEPAAGWSLGRFARISPDHLGNVWVADSSNRRVYVLEPVQ